MGLHLGQRVADDGHHGHQPAAGEDGRPAATAARWAVPVLVTVATTGQGVPELAATIAGHGDYLRASGLWAARERARSREEIERLVRDRLMDRLAATLPAEERAALITAVAERRLDPYTAADRLLALAAPDPDGA